MPADCCDVGSSSMMVAACAPGMAVMPINEWVTTRETRGDAIQSVPCPPKKATGYVRIEINDAGSLATEAFLFGITVGNRYHKVKICNPLKQKSPLTQADVVQFWVNSFLADPGLLSEGIYAKLVSSSADTVAVPATYSIEIELSKKGCSVAVEAISFPVLAPVVVTTLASGGASKLKPGMFVSYDLTGPNMSVRPYEAASPYAGYYELPSSVRDSASMAMRLYGGSEIANSQTSSSAGSCGEDCGSCGGSGCCTIRRTGPALLKLKKAIAAADLVGQPILIQDADGGLTLAASGTAAPAGSVVIPVPYTFLLNPNSIGSSVVQVILH